VSFELPASSHVVVEIFSATGQRIQTIADDDLSAGPHTLTWNVDRAMPSGVYFYKVRTSSVQSSGKITRID
jgi:flagellar hook assembly protein FlgD